MSATRPERLTYLLDEESAKPASQALVPVVQSAQWVPPAPRFPSPDPTFVTQLLACAEQLTRRGPCACDSAADALSAYARQSRGCGAGFKTRQMI